MTKRTITRRRFLTYSGTAIAMAGTSNPVLGQSTRAYRIVPNSRRDQSAAFQTMINDAARTGDPVRLPAGRFVLSKINIPNGCTLSGQGVSTVLVANNNGPLLSARHGGFVSIANLTVDATASKPTSENQGIIDFRYIESANLANLTIKNGGRDGIYFERCGGRIDQCMISRMDRFGIFAVQSTGLSIASNSVRACGNGGIIVQRWEPGADGTTIERNEINDIGAARGGTGQWGNGINVFQAHNVNVNQNKVSNCAFSAIRMNGAHNTMITNNACLKSGETAIYAEFAYRDVQITGNEIDGAANGISATNLNNGGRGSIITNNRIRNITAPGPYVPEAPFFGHGISVEADGVVTANIIENANSYGINIGWGPYLENVDVVGNLITNAEIGIGVSVADGAGNARIKENTIKARNGAIRSHLWDKISTDDLGINPERAPKTVTLSGNTII